MSTKSIGFDRLKVPLYETTVASTIKLDARDQRRRTYETPSDRNTEKIERRTSNVQRRTSNIDGAALYLFNIKRPQIFEC